MKQTMNKLFSVSLIVVIVVVMLLSLMLSPEGAQGLWRKIAYNIFIMIGAGLIGRKLLSLNNNWARSTKLHIVLGVVVFILTVFISVPCITDFSSEHKVREVLKSSCKLFPSSHSYYILLNTGEKFEISSDTYFSLLGHPDCNLTIEYYPNSKTAVRISWYSD